MLRNCIILSILLYKGPQIKTLADAFHKIAENQIYCQHPYHCLFELLCRVSYKLKCFSKLITCIKDAACKHYEIGSHQPLEFSVFAKVLHKWSSRIVNEDDSALQPPLVNKHNTILDIWCKLCIWNQRLVSLSVDVWLTKIDQEYEGVHMHGELKSD